MKTSIHSEAPGCEALSAKQAAQLCGVSQRHWWSLHSRGATPTPVHLGRATRWIRQELTAWLAAGCPNRDKWEAVKGGAR